MYNLTIKRTTTGEEVYNQDFYNLGKAYNRMAEWCDEKSYTIEEAESGEGYTAGGYGYDYTIELTEVNEEPFFKF